MHNMKNENLENKAKQKELFHPHNNDINKCSKLVLIQLKH